jgi:N-acetylneuraminate synthase
MTATSESARARVFFIAEAGVNHNGDRDKAFSLVDVAADSGADAVKFQTFKASRLATARAPKAAYQTVTTEPRQNQLEMLKALELPRDWHEPLKQHALARGIEFISTPFDSQSLDFLIALGMPRLKVPSGELTNAPLLWRFARSGLPMILSTGMATLSEVEVALAVVAHALGSAEEPQSFDEVLRGWSDPRCRASLADKVTLLHCTSQYPTPMAEVNLSAMDTLRVFGLPVGYSDHTEGSLIALAAVARGARVIEKHFTLDRSLPGPDHLASIEPPELASLVKKIRMLEQAMGDGTKAPQASEWDTRRAARQCVIAAQPVTQGEILVRAQLTTARTGSGIPAFRLWDLVGRRASRSYAEGEPLTE